LENHQQGQAQHIRRHKGGDRATSGKHRYIPRNGLTTKTLSPIGGAVSPMPHIISTSMPNHTATPSASQKL
jgi:hypothetical protein